MKIWDKRKEILRNILLSYKPNIIGTQEGREPQLRNLETLLNFKIQMAIFPKVL